MADEITLKGAVSALDEVPESHRKLYTQVGDKFILSEVKIEDVTGLKNKAEALSNQWKETRDKLKKYDGVDVDAYNEWLANKGKAEEDAAKKTGDFEKLKETHAAQLKAKDDALAATSQQLHSAVIVRDTHAALDAAGATKLGKILLPRLLLDAQQMIEGQPRVIDAAGKVRLNSKGDPMTVAELAAEYKSNPEFAGVFEASGSGGTGSPVNASGGSGGANAIKRDAFLKLPPADQMAHVKKHGAGSVVE